MEASFSETRLFIFDCLGSASFLCAILWQTRQFNVVTCFFTNKCWTTLKAEWAFRHNGSQGRNQVKFPSDNISYNDCLDVYLLLLLSKMFSADSVPIPYKIWKYTLCPEKLGVWKNFFLCSLFEHTQMSTYNYIFCIKDHSVYSPRIGRIWTFCWLCTIPVYFSGSLCAKCCCPVALELKKYVQEYVQKDTCHM